MAEHNDFQNSSLEVFYDLDSETNLSFSVTSNELVSGDVVGFEHGRRNNEDLERRVLFVSLQLYKAGCKPSLNPAKDIVAYCTSIDYVAQGDFLDGETILDLFPEVVEQFDLLEISREHIVLGIMAYGEFKGRYSQSPFMSQLGFGHEELSTSIDNLKEGFSNVCISTIESDVTIDNFSFIDNLPIDEDDVRSNLKNHEIDAALTRLNQTATRFFSDYADSEDMARNYMIYRLAHSYFSVGGKSFKEVEHEIDQEFPGLRASYLILSTVLESQKDQCLEKFSKELRGVCCVLETIVGQGGSNR